MVKCHHCARNLREHERYCDFCEEDLTEVVDKTVKIKKTTKKVIKKAKKIEPKQPKIWVYCVKCKKKVIAKDPKNYLMKNNRKAIKGICPHCSTKVFRIIGMNKK